MRFARLVILIMLCCHGPGLVAQPAITEQKDHREVLKMGLYPPDLLMRQQQRLGITSEQRKAIASLVKTFQSEVTELQWSMPNEQQKLQQMLRQYPVAAPEALRQASMVLEMESRFKQAHFELLIALKNQLTEEQVKTIDTAIRRRLSGKE